jgi:hypothetical protein
MNTIALRAEAALHAHPNPALRLAELLALIAHDVDRSLTSERFRAILEDHPDRFRILDSWSRRWTVRASGAGEGSAWVVAIADPGRPPDGPRSAVRLRESVRWLARSVDRRSHLEVSRWYAIAMAEREARPILEREAA